MYSKLNDQNFKTITVLFSDIGSQRNKSTYHPEKYFSNDNKNFYIAGNLFDNNNFFMML